MIKLINVEALYSYTEMSTTDFFLRNNTGEVGTAVLSP
jgi:hypothetical protein